MSDAVTIKIKRRASSGAAGSPSSLKSGELAFNENASDKKLYYGYGDDGNGTATSVIAIAAEQIPNAGLANSSVTINSQSLSLGGSLTLDTDNINEGSTNLYYSDASARAAISGDASTGLSYNSSTGVALLSGIPNASLTNSSITINGSAIALGESVSTSFSASDGSVSTTIANGDTLTIQGTANEISVSNSSGTLTVGLPDDVTIASGLTVGGNLTVNGTVSTINSTTVTVDDKNIELGSTDSPTDSTADGGGITLKGDTDKTINWVNATDSWTFNQSINIIGSGYGLKIGGSEIVTSNRQLINVTLSGITVDGGTF